MSNENSINCFGGSGCFLGGVRPRMDADVPANGEPDLTGKLVNELSMRDGACEHPAVPALKAGRFAISFSGGGFLAPYFIGVASSLVDLRILHPACSSPDRPTPLAGASAGSLIAASLASGLTPTEILDSFMTMVRDVRRHGSFRRLEIAVRRQLEAALPPDAAERCGGGGGGGGTASASAPLTVGVSRLFPHPHTRRVAAFRSREDLIEALLASCHIPRYFNGELTRRFRGRVSVDGGLTELMPVPAAPHDFLLKVCCFPREHVARLPVFNRRRALKHLALGIAPDTFGPWPLNYRQMLAAALHPGSDDFLNSLWEAGRRDAALWAASAGLGPPRPDLLPPVLIPIPHLTPPDLEAQQGTPTAAAAAVVTAPDEEPGVKQAAEAAEAIAATPAAEDAVAAVLQAAVEQGPEDVPKAVVAEEARGGALRVQGPTVGLGYEGEAGKGEAGAARAVGGAAAAPAEAGAVRQEVQLLAAPPLAVARSLTEPSSSSTPSSVSLPPPTPCADPRVDGGEAGRDGGGGGGGGAEGSGVGSGGAGGGKGGLLPGLLCGVGSGKGSGGGPLAGAFRTAGAGAVNGEEVAVCGGA